MYAHFGIDDNGGFRQEIVIDKTNIHIFTDYARLEGANDIGLYLFVAMINIFAV